MEDRRETPDARRPPPSRETALPSAAPPSRLRAWWPRVRLLVSIGLLVAVVSRIDTSRALAVLSDARPGFILLAVVVAASGRFFAALRWYILIRAINTEVPYFRLVRLTFIGMFLQFLPAGTVALEIGRVYGLSRTTDDLAGSFASVLLERIFGLAALIVVALVGLAFAPPGVPRILSRLAWVGFVALGLAAWAMMSRPMRALLDRALAALRLDPIRERLAKLWSRLDETRGSAGLLGWSAVAALANTAFRIVPAWLLAIALGIGVSLPQLFVIVPLIYLAGQIPISIGGLGVREVGWVALLGVIGVPSSDAIVLSLLLVAMVLVVSLPGAWMYARHGLDVPGDASDVPGDASDVPGDASGGSGFEASAGSATSPPVSRSDAPPA